MQFVKRAKMKTRPRHRAKMETRRVSKGIERNFTSRLVFSDLRAA
jgi:hypothetical protein